MAISTNPVKTFICTPPPPGIADSSSPPDFEALKPRKRIVLPEQEENTCLYAAADRLRLPMGEQTSANHPLRKGEVKFLEAKESRLKIDREIYWKKNILAEMESLHKKNITKAIASQFIRENHKILKEDVSNLLNEFIGQDKHDDFREFVMEEFSSRFIQHVKEYFSFGVNDQAIKEEISHKIDTDIQSEKNRGFTQENAAYLAIGIVNRAILIDDLNFQKSKWHPEKPTSALIKEIDENGPLLVIGKFGKMYYKDPPFKLKEKIQATVFNRTEERGLWGWRPNAERIERQNPHAVIIVGALDKTEGAKKIELVYFIDPLDPSDPKNPEAQKIYVMSMRRFREGLCDLLGIHKRRNGEIVFKDHVQDGTNEYAVHGNTKINYL